MPESEGSCGEEEEDAYVGDVGGRVSDKKRLRMSVKGEVLGTVVSGGKNMTGTQIMTTLGASRSLAFKISKMASKYPSAGRQVYEMPKVRCSKEVLATMAWLVDHLVDFPYKDLLATFQENGRLDVCESASVNHRVWAAEARKERAHDVWAKNLSYFDGRDGMNTLVAVLHSPLSVSTLVRAVEADATDLVAHILVVRIGGVYLLLLTDKRATKRFPADWFMRIGDHTSAYLWLNLKEPCWEKFAGLTRVVEVRRLSEVRRLRRLAQDVSGGVAGSGGGGGGRDGGAGVKKKSSIGSSGESSSSVPVILPWSKLSQPTIAGMHLLSILFSRCEAATHTFRYVQPEVQEGGSHVAVDVGPSVGAQAILEKAQQGGKRVRTGKKRKKAAAASELQAPDPAQWCLEVEAFVKTFAVHKKRRVVAAAPVAPGEETAMAAQVAPVAALEEQAAVAAPEAPVAPQEEAAMASPEAPVGPGEQAAVAAPPLVAPIEEAVVVAAPPVVDCERGLVAASEDWWATGLTEENVAELVWNDDSGGLLLPHSGHAQPDTQRPNGGGRQRGGLWGGALCEGAGQWQQQPPLTQPLTQLQRHKHYQHDQAEMNAICGLPYDDYADDDDAASDNLPQRVRAAPRQQRRPDQVEDWCDMDDSAVKGYGMQWGIGEAMGEFSGGSTAVW